MNLRRDFELLNSVKTLKDYGDFRSWVKCALHYDMTRRLWEAGSRKWWFEWDVPLKFQAFEPWSPVRGYLGEN